MNSTQRHMQTLRLLGACLFLGYLGSELVDLAHGLVVVVIPLFLCGSPGQGPHRLPLLALVFLALPAFFFAF